MSVSELLVALFQSITEHVSIPERFSWAPLAASAAATAVGLLLLLRGARWALPMAASGFFVLGGLGGWFVAPQIATPQAITAGFCGVLAALIGVGFFRLWQATALATCLMAIAFSVYFVQVLTPEVADWLSPEPQGELVTLKPPGTVIGEEQPTVGTKLASLWSHLSANVPNFQISVWAILLSSGLAGLVFGLLLPRASRALWAATVGTIALGVGVAGLMKQVTPASLEWLKDNPGWGLAIVGFVWAVAFVLNLWSVRKPRGKPDEARHSSQKLGSKPAVA